jgi:hypothetical protein
MKKLHDVIRAQCGEGTEARRLALTRCCREAKDGGAEFLGLTEMQALQAGKNLSAVLILCSGRI